MFAQLRTNSHAHHLIPAPLITKGQRSTILRSPFITAYFRMPSLSVWATKDDRHRSKLRPSLVIASSLGAEQTRAAGYWPASTLHRKQRRPNQRDGTMWIVNSIIDCPTINCPVFENWTINWTVKLPSH